ncbi:MAG TPA: hypothetical protein VN626_06490 [Clostridia bacterium]|nr:hypothetical protein [Clostridia bacterium]
MNTPKIQDYPQEEEDTMSNRYLTFLADGQLFGVSIVDLVQIVGCIIITKIENGILGGYRK